MAGEQAKAGVPVTLGEEDVLVSDDGGFDSAEVDGANDLVIKTLDVDLQQVDVGGRLRFGEQRLQRPTRDLESDDLVLTMARLDQQMPRCAGHGNIPVFARIERQLAVGGADCHVVELKCRLAGIVGLQCLEGGGLRFDQNAAPMMPANESTERIASATIKSADLDEEEIMARSRVEDGCQFQQVVDFQLRLLLQQRRLVRAECWRGGAEPTKMSKINELSEHNVHSQKENDNPSGDSTACSQVGQAQLFFGSGCRPSGCRLRSELRIAQP